MKGLKKCYMVRFSKKTGKVDKTMSAWGSALLQLWVLQNTPKTKDALIFDEDGNVIAYCEGNESGFPSLSTSGCGVIDDYCPGLLEVLKNDEED